MLPVLLNYLINPVFNRIRDSIVTNEEKEKARQFAVKAMKTDEFLPVEEIKIKSV